MKTSSRGFTVIELIAIIVILGIATVVFFLQKSSLETTARDEVRKTAINAMHYSLEEVYHPKNGYYPRSLSETVIPSVDPALFKDPEGIKIGESNSEYRYEATDCDGDRCRSYTLRTTLENEADYIKENRDR
jgi:Tfp pilus assembly protein PilE